MTDLATLLASAWRIIFLAASAPIVGAVLLLAIARLTGANWTALAPLAAAAPAIPIAGALLGLAQATVVAPEHLMPWMAGWAVALRAIAAGGALAFASARLRTGARQTFAAIVLAGYALAAMPLASDWLLGQTPGHPVSAIGMMQFTGSVAAATAVMLASGLGAPQFRQDMAKLMIAAALGLGYLTFMDDLIVWYGNLPSRVAFYVERSSGPIVGLVWGALLTGLIAPILLLALGRTERTRRLAGASVLEGSFLFYAWWVAGGASALLVSLALTLILIAAVLRARPHGDAHA